MVLCVRNRCFRLLCACAAQTMFAHVDGNPGQACCKMVMKRKKFHCFTLGCMSLPVCIYCSALSSCLSIVCAAQVQDKRPGHSPSKLTPCICLPFSGGSKRKRMSSSHCASSSCLESGSVVCEVGMSCKVFNVRMKR